VTVGTKQGDVRVVAHVGPGHVLGDPMDQAEWWPMWEQVMF